MKTSRRRRFTGAEIHVLREYATPEQLAAAAEYERRLRARLG
jgi:hypothetical protein